ncbi:hypothetical protein [uncultured Sulfitobacter sp.]|nr:hypothetical protein [uncultured Sulfitobacter sp.]
MIAPAFSNHIKGGATSMVGVMPLPLLIKYRERIKETLRLGHGRRRHG